MPPPKTLCPSPPPRSRIEWRFPPDRPLTRTSFISVSGELDDSLARLSEPSLLVKPVRLAEVEKTPQQLAAEMEKTDAA